MDAGDLDSELGDRGGADRADDPSEFGGDRVEGPADPVIVENLGRQREHLFNSPRPGPVLDMDKRGR